MTTVYVSTSTPKRRAWQICDSWNLTRSQRPTNTGGRPRWSLTRLLLELCRSTAYPFGVGRATRPTLTWNASTQTWYTAIRPGRLSYTARSGPTPVGPWRLDASWTGSTPPMHLAGLLIGR